MSAGNRLRAWTRPWHALGVVVGSTFGSSAVTLAVTLVAVRLLPTAEYGRFVFFVGTTALVGSLCDLGVSARTVTAYDSVARGWHDPALDGYWSAQLLSYGGGAAVTAAIGALTPVASYLHVPPILIVLAGINGALIGLASFLATVLQADRLWAKRGALVLAQSAARAFPTFVGLLLGTAERAAAGAVIGGIVGLAIGFRMDAIRERLAHAVSPSKRMREAVRVWHASRWFGVAVAVGAAATYLPLAAVGRTGGPDALAIFGLALQLAAGPTLLLNSVMTLLLPTGSDVRLPLGQYLRLVRRSVAPVLVLMAGAAVVLPFVMPFVFGSEFRRSILPFEILLASIAVLLVANPVQFLHYRLGAARFVAIMDTLLLVTVAVTFVLISGHVSPPVAGAVAVLAGAIASRSLGITRLIARRRALVGHDVPERRVAP